MKSQKQIKQSVSEQPQKELHKLLQLLFVKTGSKVSIRNTYTSKILIAFLRTYSPKDEKEATKIADCKCGAHDGQLKIESRLVSIVPVLYRHKVSCQECEKEGLFAWTGDEAIRRWNKSMTGTKRRNIPNEDSETD